MMLVSTISTTLSKIVLISLWKKRTKFRHHTYQIGEHIETIDLEEEESDSIREAFEDILSSIKEQQRPVIVQRKDIINRLSNVKGHLEPNQRTNPMEIEDGNFRYKKPIN